MCNCKNVSNLYPDYCPICGSKWEKKEEPQFNPKPEGIPKVGETWVDRGGYKHKILCVDGDKCATSYKIGNFEHHWWLKLNDIRNKYVEPVKHTRHMYLLQGSGPPFISIFVEKNPVTGYQVLAYKQIEITEGEGV